MGTISDPGGRVEGRGVGVVAECSRLKGTGTLQPVQDALRTWPARGERCISPSKEGAILRWGGRVGEGGRGMEGNPTVRKWPARSWTSQSSPSALPPPPLGVPRGNGGGGCWKPSIPKLNDGGFSRRIVMESSFSGGSGKVGGGGEAEGRRRGQQKGRMPKGIRRARVVRRPAGQRVIPCRPYSSSPCS